MPRTTKDTNNQVNSDKKKKTVSADIKDALKKTKAVPTKKETTKKAKVAPTKKETAKKAKVAPTKKETAKKSKVAPTKKETAKKAKVAPTKKAKAVSTKKETTKKAKVAPTKKETTKKTKVAPTKKETTKKTKAVSTKKTPSKEMTSKRNDTKSNSKIDILEYYDLPYRYNQTIIKVLAQTPTTLFVYWDISDEDRKNYVKQYGNDFFETTVPVLIITNKTMNYSFEIEINDFANCWYFNVNDEKCEYSVELGRRPKGSNNNSSSIPNNYLYITSSNQIESPNGHFLFEKEQKTLYYRNVKTNEVYSKDIANLNYLIRMGRIYKIYDIYQKLYKDGDLLKPNNNPSSRFF